MPSPETFGCQNERRETHPNLYSVAAKFEDQHEAGRVYEAVQESIFDAKCDLSVYRLQLNSVWHVAALGQTPPPGVNREIRDQMSKGELTRLPDAVVDALLERRAEANRIGPWVEGHYR